MSRQRTLTTTTLSLLCRRIHDKASRSLICMRLGRAHLGHVDKHTMCRLSRKASANRTVGQLRHRPYRPQRWGEATQLGGHTPYNGGVRGKEVNLDGPVVPWREWTVWYLSGSIERRLRRVSVWISAVHCDPSLGTLACQRPNEVFQGNDHVVSVG